MLKPEGLAAAARSASNCSLCVVGFNDAALNLTFWSAPDIDVKLKVALLRLLGAPKGFWPLVRLEDWDAMELNPPKFAGTAVFFG